jgi:hypothetical protein
MQIAVRGLTGPGRRHDHHPHNDTTQFEHATTKVTFCWYSSRNGPNAPTLYTMGNNLNVVNTYDSLGRLNGSFVCAAGGEGALQIPPLRFVCPAFSVRSTRVDCAA